MGFVFYNQNKNIHEVYTLNPFSIQFPRLFEYLDEAIKYLKNMDYFGFDYYTTTPLHHTSLAQNRLNIKKLKSVNIIMDDFNLEVEEIKSQIRAEQKVCETTNPMIKKLQNDLLQLENRRERVIQESKKQIPKKQCGQ